MNVRTIGSSRPMNTVAAPYFAKNRSAVSISWGLISRYRPYRSRKGRPPYAPIAYAINDPRVFPMVATIATIQNDQALPVSGSI